MIFSDRPAGDRKPRSSLGSKRFLPASRLIGAPGTSGKAARNERASEANPSGERDEPANEKGEPARMVLFFESGPSKLLANRN